MGPTESRIRLFAPHWLCALLLFACVGCDAREAPSPEESTSPEQITVGRKVFLLNIDRTTLRVDGESGHDFTNTRDNLPLIAEVRVGQVARRALVLDPRSEVSIPNVLPYAGELCMELGFDGLAEAQPRSFTVSVSARRGASEEQLWSREVTQPKGTEDRTWEPVRIALPAPEQPGATRETELVFRVAGAGKRRKPGRPVALPAFANPRLEGDGYQVPVWSGEHRNVVVFLIDTLRADHVGAYGHSAGTTPRFDALAKQGHLFLKASAPSSWTKASVASLLTARMPSKHGAEDYPHRLPDSVQTVAEVFESAGYRTGAVGANRWIFYPSFNFSGGYEDFLQTFDATGIRGPTADSVVDEAIDWIEQHGQDPFFLYVHVLDPHSPYEPIDGPGDFLEEPYPGMVKPSNRGENAFVRFDPEELAPGDFRYLDALYNAEIAFADAQMGRLIDCLQERGVWEETTFVALSDHGEEFGEHGGWEHSTTLYGEQTHVPLVIVPPASMGRAARLHTKPVSLIDVAPTLCALAGIAAPPAFAGRALVPSELGAAQPRSLVASELNLQDRSLFSVTDGAWKYIASFGVETENGRREEAYRLDADPAESENQIGEVPAPLLAAFRKAVFTVRSSAEPEGIYLELSSGGKPATVRGTLRSNRTLRDVNPLQTEYSVSGPRLIGDRASFAGDVQRVAIFELEVGPGDPRDLVHLRTSADARLVFEGRLSGGVTVELGPSARPADLGTDKKGMLTFEFQAADPELECAELPTPATRPTLRVLRIQRDEVQLDPDQLEALEALGYAAGKE